MGEDNRPVVLIIEGGRDLAARITRVLADHGLETPVLASVDLLPEPQMGPAYPDICLKAALNDIEPPIKRRRPERDWKQRERQRPGRRKRR